MVNFLTASGIFAQLLLMSLQHHNVVIFVGACVGLTATTRFHDFQQVVLAYKLLMGLVKIISLKVVTK